MNRLVRERGGLRGMPADRAVLARLAQLYASVVDRAVAEGDEARVISAGEKLRGVLGALQVEAGEGGVSGDGGAGGSVIGLFSGVPSLGDRANS